jgi:uncharacterized protein (TIGR00369 family)
LKKEIFPMTDGLEAMREKSKGTMADWMQIEYLEVTPRRVVARMPVGPAVHQPFGLLHGGASVALAETVASIGAWMNVDQATQGAVGLEINANHLRGMREGFVTAVAEPLHLGGRTQVWEIKLTDEADRLVCVSRCTLAVIEQRKPG